jgi:hypothetical protein
MFNLNDKSFDGGVAIFNGGNAGKVNNVEMNVEKKKVTDADNAPDFKLFFKDEQGSLINQGFYYHKDNEQYDDEKNKNNERYLISRVLSAAKTVVNKDFVFEEFNTSKEILDYLFKLMNDNCEGKKLNVFVTYGTVNKPSQYLGLRYFNFVESADAAPSRLIKNNTDQMERIVADAPMAVNDGQTSSTKSAW